MTENDNGKTITTKVGQEIEIRLKNEQNLAGWEGGDIDGDVEAVVYANLDGKHQSRTTKQDANGKQVSYDAPSQRCTFIAAQKGDAQSDIGTYLYRFRCTKPGKATIRMVHVTPGGPNAAGRRSATGLLGEYSVTIDVKAPPVVKDPEEQTK